MKGIQIGKEEVKLSLFADDDTLHGKPERLHQKAARTDTWIQQSFRIKNQCTEIGCISIHQYEATEREIKKSIPFTITPRPIKYLGINLTKVVKDLYAENYRKLTKEIEEDTKIWKKSSWIGRTNIVKMSILPKAIYTFSVVPIKIAPAFFSKLE